MQNPKRLFIAMCFTLILTSCSSVLYGATTPTSDNSATPFLRNPTENSAIATASATPFQPEPKTESIFFGPSVPQEWIQDVGNLNVTQDVNEADLILD